MYRDLNHINWFIDNSDQTVIAHYSQDTGNVSVWEYKIFSTYLDVCVYIRLHNFIYLGMSVGKHISCTCAYADVYVHVHIQVHVLYVCACTRARVCVCV